MPYPHGPKPPRMREASSRRFVDAIKEDLTTQEKIIRWAAFAYDQGKPFTDSFLARKIPWPHRNVVARIRLEVEKQGWIERAGRSPDGLVMFAMPPARRELLRLCDPKAEFLFNESER